MIQLRRILCPIDFSDFSRRALDHALVLAHWYQSTVTLLHVREIALFAAYAPGSGVVPSAMLTPDDRQAILDSMKRLAESEAGPGAPIDFQIAEGHVADAIVAQAMDARSDLIVLGTHGRSGFERLVLGSVTEKVLRKAACPVLTVPKALGDVVPASPLFKRIVCAIDFSDCSMHALEYACSLAQEADAHLRPSRHRGAVEPSGGRSRDHARRAAQPEGVHRGYRERPARTPRGDGSGPRSSLLHG